MSKGAVKEEFSLPLRVYIEDTDAGGIVYYVNYLKFMERARTEYMREKGFGKNFIFNHELMFVVQDVKIRYLQPAQLDDELVATARVLQARGASMILAQTVRRGDTLLAEGEVRIACVDKNNLKPKRMPADILESARDSVRA